ncbi:reverse transcriptase domain-containing protein [Fructobacillus ficulneus]|uniref:Reverse transcriptase domain-containing protein n=1 Tax=Fructobacillus ficulneus TaxID=157463 RepID=A0A0K8MK30_9LACO|nr:reverse transcriptase domain-containing protein [Fructobacillus ficulneus]GAP00235.1 hypothetical protein FFIC_282480 [Fructobacillus ficulneus]
MQTSEYLKTQRKYKHFDHFVTDINFLDSVKSDSKVITSFRFLPFIQKDIISNKFNGKSIQEKKRKITLPSHHAAAIYKLYSEQLNHVYEQKIKDTPVSSAATAYRSSTMEIKRSNIHAAKEVFDFISNQQSAYVIKGDFKAFFDTLNHKYLKKRLIDVLSSEPLTIHADSLTTNTLPKDWYAIFNSLTKYQYISTTDLEDSISYKKNNSQYSYFNCRKDFDNFYKKNKKKFHTNRIGIPQGTSLSALLANIYMMKFDLKICLLIEKLGGLYRRYSDDFIIVLPGKSVSQNQAEKILEQIIIISEQDLFLTIERHKTNFYKFENHSFQKISNSISQQQTTLNYLGFRFTGHSVYLREKSIYKFAYRSKHGIKFLIRDLENKKLIPLLDEDSELTNKKIRQIQLVKKKLDNNMKFQVSNRLKQRYLSGSNLKRTFLGYANLAQNILEHNQENYEVLILKQARRRVIKNQREYHKQILEMENNLY